MKTSEKKVELKKYVKPLVVSQELTVHALLGENGWMSQSSNQRPIALLRSM